MTRIPQSVGDTFADVVTWQWDRARMRWSAVLPDGSRLVVSREMRRRKAWWVYEIDGATDALSVPRSGQPCFENASFAEEAALKAYRHLAALVDRKRKT